jgi:GDP/UDP-N,N'-diacetylbacillosamine 2-epimerase (hydrolysing)
MKRKIVVLTGARAEYGILTSVMREIQKSRGLKLITLVTGSHLIPKLGYSLSEIIKDGFGPDLIAPMYPRNFKEFKNNQIPIYLSRGLKTITKALNKLKPDIMLVLGDRGEVLVGSIAAAYLNIPIAHIHGGDHVKGADLDDSLRHAITKLAHIHFPATQKSAERIIQMGEEDWRVHKVGSPSIDSIMKEKILSKEVIEKKLGFKLKFPLILVLQHAVSSELDLIEIELKETLDAVKEIGKETIVLFPSADPGTKSVIKAIESYKKYPFLHIYKTLPYKLYLNLMNISNVMVGNSSSGIIEAPSFHLPVVNIGLRQKDRERSTNIIDVNHNKEEIKKAIIKALCDKEFIAKVKKCKNFYGDGKASKRIVNILNKIKIDKKLLHKQFIIRKYN